MHSDVADKRPAFKDVRDIRAAILEQHDDTQEPCESRNTEIGRISRGTRAVVGGKAVVKEVESGMAIGGIHHERPRHHWTRTREVRDVFLPGPSYIITINGRGIRKRRAAAANLKMFHVCSDGLRRDFEDTFAHLE